MTPHWTLLLGAPISAHSFPFPLWTKLQAGSSRSHGLRAFACQLEGDAPRLWNGNMERMLKKQVTFAHWGFLSAYKDFVLSEPWSCYLFSDALQKVLPKSQQCDHSKVDLIPGIPGVIRSQKRQKAWCLEA